jgi:gamma-glutamyltranspeptidase/glutathione hydrolase
MVLKDGRLVMPYGTPGNDMQPQAMIQFLVNQIDYGMDVQQAIEAPRWYSFPGTDPEHVHKAAEVRLESRFAPETFDGLRSRGHQVVELGTWGAPSAVQLILRQPNGVLVGGSDPRAGGIALGF